MKIFILLTLLVVQSTVFSEVLPIQNFSKHGDYLDLSLSPDGKHISARVRTDGRVVLVILNAQTMEVVSGITPGKSNEIQSASWINDTRLIYKLQEKQAFSDKPVSTGELYAVNYDGKKSSFIYGYRAQDSTTNTNISIREASYATAEVISTLPDDKRHILIAEYRWTLRGNTYYDDRKKDPIISRLNVYTGKKRQVDVIPFPGATVMATADGEVKFARWVDENNELRAASRNSNDDEFVEINADSVLAYVPIRLSKDGKKVYFNGNVGKNAINTLFELDIASNTMTQVFSDMDTDIEKLNWDPQLDKPVVGFSYPDTFAYSYAAVESKTATLHKALATAFGNQIVSIDSHTEDGKTALVHVYSDINPGEYYLFNTQENNADFIWANRSWLDPSKMAKQLTFKFTSDDGLDIHALITMPANHKEAGKVPMVVKVHGGPHGVRDTWGFDSEVQLLANRGYAVLQINYRGSGGFGAVFQQAGYRQWGGKMIDDIIQGTEYASSNFAVDPDNMCIYGDSYGGYAALMSVVRAPNLFKCAIGYVGLYDLNYAYSKSDISDNLGGLAYLEEVIGTDKEELAEFSPINHVEKIKAEVMLIHGERDTRVDVANAEVMLEKLEGVGKSVPFLNFAASGHGVYDEEGRLTLYTGLIDFLAQHLNQ